LVRIEELGYKLELTKDAKAYLADKGYDQQFGARPLARAIQRYIEDPLAEEIINSKITEGDTIKIKLDKKADELKIDVVPGELKEEAEK
jgi:ATP-dependent Clp protease ATP-binding subunit ClpC